MMSELLNSHWHINVIHHLRSLPGDHKNHQCLLIKLIFHFLVFGFINDR
jgi:hypothetical protein